MTEAVKRRCFENVECKLFLGVRGLSGQLERTGKYRLRISRAVGGKVHDLFQEQREN